MTTTLTHSAISMFRQCPRRYEHRHVDKLVPSHWQDSPALRFGTAFHNWLEAWYKKEPAPPTPHLSEADAACLQGAALAYVERYPEEYFKVVAVEYQFEQDVLNPDTGAKSPLFRLKGKVDMVIELEGELWIMEHKTSTATGVNDLDRVGIDAQVLTYADCIGRETGATVAGVIYNVVKRCQLSQKGGETEAEYQAREAERSPRQRKDGESDEKYAKRMAKLEPLKRKLAETPAEFTARVAEWYKGEDAMLRERARINPAMIEQNRKNIWMTVQSMHACRRAKHYTQNAGVTTGACAKWGRECEYAPLCKSLKSAHALADYKFQEPHSELEDAVEMD